MKKLSDYVSDLTSVELDVFVRVMNRLESQASPARIEGLQEQLEEVKRKIDEVNARRDDLSLNQDELRECLRRVDKALDENGSWQDLIQLRLLLHQYASELEEEIATTRPVELLARKAKLRREIEKLRLVGRLAHMLCTTAKGNNG